MCKVCLDEYMIETCLDTTLSTYGFKWRHKVVGEYVKMYLDNNYAISMSPKEFVSKMSYNNEG